jgi:probable rRNA maturation factor
MPVSLGDVAIAYETCAREAGAAAKPLEHHALHLLVHGTLHLLGFDHEREGDAELMEGLESEILRGLGVADPYAGMAEGAVLPEARDG